MNRPTLAAIFGSFCFSTVLAIGAPARAEPPPPDYAALGGYIGAGAGFGVETFEGLLHRQDFTTSYGADVWGGYRFLPSFAIELEVQYLPNYDWKLNPGYSLDNLNATVNAKGYMLTGRFQPYGLVGMGASGFREKFEGSRDDEVGFAMRFGAGIEAYATPHLAGVFQIGYLLHTGAVKNLNFVTFTLGAQYRF